MPAEPPLHLSWSVRRAFRLPQAGAALIGVGALIMSVTVLALALAAWFPSDRPIATWPLAPAGLCIALIWLCLIPGRRAMVARLAVGATALCAATLCLAALGADATGPALAGIALVTATLFVRPAQPR